MKRFPDGITGGQIRQELAKEGLSADEQIHLDRRKRDLKKWFIIKKRPETQMVRGKTRNVVLYIYGGVKKRVTDEGDVSEKLKAAVRHAAHGRCEMCGRSIAEHGVVLQVDHKLPRDWGGTNDRENLWALCEECNRGKKAYFSSVEVEPETMNLKTAVDSLEPIAK